MSTWHAPPDTLARFARAPERLDPATASSVEQHLVACADCRAGVASASDAAALQRSWAEVADTIDRPRATFGERLLRRTGMPSDAARLVSATSGLRTAWLLATALIAALAVATARASGTDTAFLAVAPMVPLGAVLLTFLPAEEPGGEAGIATPAHGTALVVRRALAVLVPTFVVLAVAGLGQPDLTAGGARWVLPGLGLTLSALALSTAVRIMVAVSSIALGWTALIFAVTALSGPTVLLADSPTFGVLGQATALAATIAAAIVLGARRHRLSTLEVTW